MNDPTTITDALRTGRFGTPIPVAADGGAAHRVEFAHRQIIDALSEIVQRATTLLDEVRSGDVDVAYSAIVRIADGAGASGPIHSRYASVLRHAALIEGTVAGLRGGYAITQR